MAKCKNCSFKKIATSRAATVREPPAPAIKADNPHCLQGRRSPAPRPGGPQGGGKLAVILGPKFGQPGAPGTRDYRDSTGPIAIVRGLAIGR